MPFPSGWSRGLLPASASPRGCFLLFMLRKRRLPNDCACGADDKKGKEDARSREALGLEKKKKKKSAGSRPNTEGMDAMQKYEVRGCEQPNAQGQSSLWRWMAGLEAAEVTGMSVGFRDPLSCLVAFTLLCSGLPVPRVICLTRQSRAVDNLRQSHLVLVVFSPCSALQPGALSALLTPRMPCPGCVLCCLLLCAPHSG